MKNYIIISVLIACNFITFSQWQQTNGPNGGYVYCFVKLQNSLFSGIPGDGVYISTNNGLSWNRSNTGLPNPAYIQTLSTDGNNIYAGGLGLYTSSNFGAHWSSILGDLPSNNIKSIVSLPNETYVGIYSYGVYKSTNNGLNWLSVNTGLPLSPNIMCMYTSNGSLFLSLYSIGVYKSSNGGLNWNLLTNGLPANQHAFSFSSNSNYLFAGYENKIYRSSDNGNNWQQAGQNVPAARGLTTSNNDVFVATSGGGVYVSFNNGSNWNQINNGIPSHNYISSIIYSNGNVIAGTEWTGIYTTTNNGISWSPCNTNISSTRVYTINSIGNSLFAGTDGNLIFSTTDSGDNWNWLNNGLPSLGFIGSIYSYNNRLFIGFQQPAGIYYSLNNGTNWILSSSSISGFSFTSINDNLFVGGGPIFRSTNAGNNWTSASSGLPNYQFCYALVTLNNNLYCGLDRNGIYISTNLGTSWSALGSGLTNFNITSMNVNNSNIYACTDTSGIFKSTNGGATWNAANNGLSSLRTTVIYSYLNYLFLGTRSGLFMSNNEGNSWNDINAGLSNTWITSLYIHDDFIYGGVYLQGMWKRPLSEIIGITQISQEILIDFHLHQNYPNPFNPTTNIKFDIPKKSFLKLYIYDITGRVIKTLVNEQLNAGSYQVDFDGSNLSSGIYYYRLLNADYSITKKMVLLK